MLESVFQGACTFVNKKSSIVPVPMDARSYGIYTLLFYVVQVIQKQRNSRVFIFFLFNINCMILFFRG